MTLDQDKQLVRALTELEIAPAHSHDLADELGISPKTSSTLLSELFHMGLLEIIGRTQLSKRGPPSRIYALKRARP